jgi:hypothetical protein
MRVVNARVNEGFNASTPVELAYALVSNGGVRNTDVILIMNNRSAVEQIIQTHTNLHEVSNFQMECLLLLCNDSNSPSLLKSSSNS